MKNIVKIALAVFIALYLLSGIYVVQPNERGVVLRFGRVVHDRIGPGIHYHYPYPIERVERPNVTEIRRMSIGYKLAVIPPMQLLDMAGLDIYSAVASYLNQDLSTEKGLSSTIQALVDQGRLGMKTKGGIFDYTDEQIAELRAQRFGGLVKVRKALDS